MPLRTYVPEPGSSAWRLTDDRGRTVALAAERYPDRPDAVADAERFRTAAPDAAVVDAVAGGDAATDVLLDDTPTRFVLTGRDGSVSWSFSDADGDLARAPRSFETSAAARAAVQRVQSLLRRTASAEPSPKAFDPETLDHAILTAPLVAEIEREQSNKGHRVLIELDQDHVRGVSDAKQRVVDLVRDLTDSERGGTSRGDLRLERVATERSSRYVVATLTGRQVRDLVARDGSLADELRQTYADRGDPLPDLAAPPTTPTDDPDSLTVRRAPRRIARAIFRIWPDFPIRALLTRSTRTVKADAARTAFTADGAGVVWAVVDSGVDESHPHFQTYRTLDLPGGIAHRDLRGRDPELPLQDGKGHGTHVAGIIAGQAPSGDLLRLDQVPDSEGTSRYVVRAVGPVSGVAPKAKILSLRILDDDGNGFASDAIAALRYVDELNQGGRDIRVHGVNLSVGYEFDPEWYACGHTPLCQEVDLLVRSGVVVVTAAGNTGYGTSQADARLSKTGLDLSINDPGNAERAITVGATHPEEPHRYGVSYFSSKGPTSDGRAKPDLVAPGERVLSCAAGRGQDKAERRAAREAPDAPTQRIHYVADSGTSMAAPHVSGAIAAFLSVRTEFRGRPDEVKSLFLRTATDLGRDPYFQGRGLLDLMRALQDV